MSLFTTARSAVGVVTRHNDINIVFLLVTVIALMIIPLPTPVVDTLIGVNMALSFTILMMTMYVRTVLTSRSFPRCSCSPPCSGWASTSRPRA